MTIGWVEAIIIIIVVAFVIGLAFRGGITRGRMTRGSSLPRKDDDDTPR